mmetsp:Transcript_2919/g.8723  ORF Transcript_2919/g.8723 Transcript_2919/m.8723 type:complete len:136 (+) Transcript_2919:65-472(+)
MSGPPSFLAVLLLCAAAAEAVSAGRGRLVRSEAQLGTVSAVVQPDGAVVGRGHAAAAVPKADDPEDADDAEFTEDSKAKEMLMKDGLEGLSESEVDHMPPYSRSRSRTTSSRSRSSQSSSPRRRRSSRSRSSRNR